MSGVNAPGGTGAAATLAEEQLRRAKEAAAATAKKGGSSNLGDKDMFLKLLVAQLKYQNPLSPTDPSQFMQQSVQFTMVEKLGEMEKSSSATLLAQMESTAASLIGKEVVATGATGSDITGKVTGYRVSVDGPVLKMGNTEVALAKVKEVRQAA